MSIIVANWSDKQLDELVDLLKSADFSPIAGFIFENMIASGNRIMTDDVATELRVTVNATDGRAVDLSPGVLLGGYVSHVSTAATINILNTTIGDWGTGQAADAAQGRYSLICIKNSTRRITSDNRWFVDDTVEPNTFSQKLTYTEREMSYFDIQVVHGTPGAAIETITVPTGYWCIAEIWIPADPTFTLPVDPNNIRDTGLVSWDTVPHWTSTSRVLRLEFWSTLFGIDHETSGANSGHHRAYAGVGTGWHIGGTEITTLGTELNALTGIHPAHVNATNLNALTDGSNVGSMHGHGSGVIGRVIFWDEKPTNTHGGTFTATGWRTRVLNKLIYNTGLPADVALSPCTVATNIGTVVLSAANQFTLPAGTYECDIRCPAVDVESHKARLYNISDAVTMMTGTSSAGGSSNEDETYSAIKGVFTIAAAKVFEIQHYCETTVASYGFGRKCNFAGELEVYTTAYFAKIG